MSSPLAKKAELPSYDTDGVKALIPHRYPMLMIDSVINVDTAKSIVGVKHVTPDEPYFPGHFPSHPVMPGVLIVEAMAQSAAVLVVHTLGESARGKVVYFMSVEEAKFRRPVKPGDTLYIHCQVLQSRSNVWKFTGTAYVGETKVADATYSAMIMETKGT